MTMVGPGEADLRWGGAYGATSGAGTFAGGLGPMSPLGDLHGDLHSENAVEALLAAWSRPSTDDGEAATAAYMRQQGLPEEVLCFYLDSYDSAV